MTNTSDSPEEQPVEHGELIEPPPEPAEREVERGSVTEPAKVMRIGSMVKQLLDEVRQAPLDERSRERLAEIYERSVTELAEALSPDLQEELRSLGCPPAARTDASASSGRSDAWCSRPAARATRHIPVIRAPSARILDPSQVSVW
jgi:hypothetical protein